MNFISDILLAAGAFSAAIYCSVLSVRLKKFTALESGMGGAIAVLSAEVDGMTKALDQARGVAGDLATSLDGKTERAEAVAARIELLLAAMHDLPDGKAAADKAGPEPALPHPEEEEGGRLRVVRRRTVRPALEAAE